MINIVIIGIGNCASSLVQGVQYYSTLQNEMIGLIQQSISGYRINDIRFVGAIDIDHRKIGKDLSEAIFQTPNCATKLSDVPFLNVPVFKGVPLDGVAKHMEEDFQVDDSQEEHSISAYLKALKPDFVVCYLPVGSEKAVKFYAQEAINAGVGFINAIPVFVCSTEEWSSKFKNAGILCAGDDIKSQFGATYLNRILVESLMRRGFTIETLYQLNVGGNTDFKNMLDGNRLETKRISKTNAVSSLLDENNSTKLRIGPSDYIPHLKDKKICYINVQGKQFGNVAYELELKLTVEDSPNSAGVMIDVIRLLKVAKDRGLCGNIDEISTFGFKHPKVNLPESEIIDGIKKFL